MIDAAAERLRDHEVVLVGVGAPVIAANRARERHAPNLQLVFESGAVGAVPARPPLSIGDPTLVSGAIASLSLADIFSYVIEGGRIDTAFVGAAEIDRTGRLNTTVIGPYDSPKSRLPGSGGAAEIVAFSRRVVVLTALERRRFPERVGFVTSEPPPSTEVLVVTDRAVLTRPPGGRELVLTALFDGETVESVQADIGWPLTVQLDPHTMEGAA
jgi:glutaconate CoA-transferase subunit B